MTVTPQLVLMIVGIACIVLAVLVLALAASYYVRNDIRSVRDDLSGRARQTGAGNRRRRAVSGARGRDASAPSAHEAVLDDVPQSVAWREERGVAGPSGEDEMDTVLDTKLRKIPQNPGSVNSYAHDVNDDTPTLVTSVGAYHQAGMAPQSPNEQELPTEVEGNEEDAPTGVWQTSGAAPSFVVVKSILAVNSGEVIVAG